MSKVLHITKYHYPYVGGTEQVCKDVIDSLSNLNMVQKVICFNEDAQDGNVICHRGETVHDIVDGIEVIRCGCIAKIASQSISLTYKRELKKVFTDLKPDIVVLHYPNPFVAYFLLPLINKNKNIKFVLYWHLDITKQKLLGKLFHGQTLALLKRADKIIATSPNYIDGSPYLSKFKDKCSVIPNCIRTERLEIDENTRAKAEKIRDKYKDKIICFGIGRHVPYKGFTYLIKASKYLDDNFEILIGGKGPLTESLKEEAVNDNKIEFCGRISDEDLPAYYLACDIFCFPSITKNEAFGIALAEGMYYGKPAVTFTIPGSGVNYVNLENVTGIECPNGDVEAYAKAIKKLANDKKIAEEYGKNAKKRVIENFMFDSFKKRIEHLVLDLSTK